MNSVYLLLGSNLGHREHYLETARLRIGKQVGEILSASRLYRTDSWGVTAQPEYLNQVLEVATLQPAQELLNTLLRMEQEMGRERAGKWGPRTIDLDILYFNEEIIQMPGLTIPHPHLHERRFTLAPLMELAPDFRHPLLGLTTTALLAQLQDELTVQPITC